ncbi:MAG: hypothetical protein KAX80_03720, partial [Planctomycetes bacterium]|nr:hypothetical protein [Planctomycetota bacterium]
MKVLTSVIIVAGVLALFAVGARAGEGAREVLLFDFESPGNFENADKLQYVAEHVTQGEKAGKVTLDQPFSPNFFFFGGSNAAGRWGEFDQFVIDVFVEGGPVTCAGFVVADGKQDWWERYNYEFKLPPGARRLAFSLGAFVRQRDQQPLDLSRLTFFAIQFTSDAEGAPATIWLDNARLVKGTGTFEVKRLFSFEGADAGGYTLEDWPPDSPEKSDLALVSEHASEGGKALQLSSRSPAGNVAFSGFESDWSGYDALAMDVFSAGDAPVKVFGWIKPDSPTADYWQRHNWERVLRPGPNSVRLSLGGLTNPRNEPVDLSNVVAFNVAVDNTVIFIDNVRLVKGVEEVKVEGLRTFDFGPSTSAVMPGFTRVSKETVYGPGRGYGWLPGGAFGRDFDIMEMLGRHRPPDDLCRDFSMPTRASFAVALPDGEYRVWLMLGTPGNGWGPWFQHRTVSVAGKAVVDEAYTAESFRRYEFQFEDAEDLPGDDLWSKYIDPLFRASEFDVAVKDGRLVLDFDSHGAAWCCMVNGLVVYPKAQAAAGARWLAGLADRRKEQYDSLHVEELPPAPAPYDGLTEADRARGYVRFVHSPDRDVQVNSVPTAEEVAASLELAAAPGEYEDACLGLLPLEDCGRVKLEVSDLAGPGGAAIPAAKVRALVVRYKALNRGAVYVISPKYLDSVAAEGVGAPAGVTRSFWIVVQVPADAKPGTYTGQATLVSEKGGRDPVALTLTVWPVKLVEPEF